MALIIEIRHARAKARSASSRRCPGHPRLDSLTARKTWTLGTSSSSWFETRGVAALLTMRVGDPHPEERALARVSKDAGPALENALVGKYAGQHFLENLPADGLVGERGVAPPPAVLLHFPGRSDKAISHLSKIRIGVVQAENQTAGADPAQREPFGPQVILQYPIVAGRFGVMHHPDRRQIGDTHRQILRGEGAVQLRRASIPDLIESAINNAKIRTGEPAQELVHRRHDVRVRIEGAAREADVGRAVVTEAAHQLLASTDDAHRQPASEALAVRRHVGADAEIFLRAAGGEAEADERLVEDQYDIAIGAGLPQRLQPFAIRSAIEGN